MRLKLKIEPRPSSTWGITLSSRMDPKEWARVRAQVYREADYQCEICRAEDQTLFCHELWSFDDRKRVQNLEGFECCCKLCSDVHHFGRSTQVYDVAYQERLVKHWCSVNKKTRADFQVYLEEIKEINRKRADKFYVVQFGRRVLT